MDAEKEKDGKKAEDKRPIADTAGTSEEKRDSAAPAPVDPRRGRSGNKEKKGGCLWWGIGIFVFVGFMLFGIVFVAFFVALMSNMESGGSLPGFNPAHARMKENFVAGNYSAPNKILVVDIKGVIADAEPESPWSASMANASYITAQLAKAAEDSSIKAVILRLDTPGGEVTAADMIHHAVKDYEKKTGNPVIASMGSVAASGGVYVAVAADYIIANRLTTTGSIGVIAQTYNYSELMKKIGLKAETYTSGPMKDILNGARPRNPEEVKIIKRFIDEVYDDFVKVVAEGRQGISEDDIRNTVLGDGRFFSGRQALKYHLIDQLGYFDDAVAKAASMAGLAKDDYKVVAYKQTFGLMDVLIGASSKPPQLKVELPGASASAKLPGNGKFFLLPPRW